MLLKWKKEKKNKTTRLSTPPPYPSRVLLTGCTERMLQRHAFCNHCRLSGSNVNVRRWWLSLFLFFWGLGGLEEMEGKGGRLNIPF